MAGVFDKMLFSGNVKEKSAMQKNIFEREPLTGKSVLSKKKQLEVKIMIETFLLLEKYFTPKLYKTQGVTSPFLHEFTPVCSLVFLPKNGGKPKLMASVENGSLSVRSKYLVGQTLKDIANHFFKAFFGEGLDVTFETSIAFFGSNPNPHTSKKVPTNRIQIHKVSFKLQFSETGSIIKNLCVETSKLQVTSKKTMKA